MLWKCMGLRFQFNPMRSVPYLPAKSLMLRESVRDVPRVIDLDIENKFI